MTGVDFNTLTLFAIALLNAFTAALGIFAVYYARESRAASVKNKESIDLIERNTNSLTTQLKTAAHRNGMVEGKRIGDEHGEDLAKKLAQGQQEGRDNERASVAAADKKIAIVAEPMAHGMAVPGMKGSGNEPIPVEDEAAAKLSKDIAKSTAESAAAATEINKRVAKATERAADAQQQIADTAADTAKVAK